MIVIEDRLDYLADLTLRTQRLHAGAVLLRRIALADHDRGTLAVLAGQELREFRSDSLDVLARDGLRSVPVASFQCANNRCV